VGGRDWYTGVFFFPRRADRLAEEDRLAALRRNQKGYNLFRSADPARRGRGTVTPRSPGRVSLADRTRRPYDPGSEERRRTDDLARRTRERQAADAVQRAAEEAEKANRGRRREQEKLATLFRLPLLARPLPTTPVVTQFSLLRSRLFPCASTAHTTSASRTWISLFRPAVPKLYACANSS
ncbi:hypothetical protein D6D27_08395, partial [Aureobasidium pullulans]